MPQITIEQATFERLQQHARPLVDSTDSVIARALNALDEKAVKHVPNGQAAAGAAEKLLDASALPDLTHTKVLDAVVDGEPISRPNWNCLRDEMLLRIMQRGSSFESLQRLLQADVNLVEGRKTDEGYHHLPAFDFSVQGQPANGACQAIMTAAKVLGLTLDIRIAWRRKEGAAYPGERARIAL